MILVGYYLTSVLDPILSRILGRKIEVAKNIDIVIVFVIAVSVLPIVIKAGKGWLAKRRARLTPAPAPETTTNA